MSCAKGLVRPLVALIMVTALFRIAAEKPAEPNPKMGINLAGPADWNTELPFVDVFRLSRQWISQRKGESWGKGPALVLDEHGWPKTLEPDCWAETPMCTIRGGHYPSGNYTLLYEGEGKITFTGAATILSQEAGKMTVKVDASRGGFFLQVRATEPDNRIRNIRLIMPGFEKTHEKEPFHPDFLKRWRGVTCIRFMDWMHTNNSKVKTWADRPKMDDATWTPKGIPLAVMIDLCNRQEADAWFCMPHLATDDYVRRFAQQVKKDLDPKRRIYIEYSNEVWNNMFGQTRYSREVATKLGLGPKERPWEGGGMYYTQRSVEIFRIWKEVFGDLDRLVRVLAWQSGNTWWMENIIFPHKNGYKEADAIAIAPYMGMNIPGKSDKQLDAETVAGWSVDQALDHLEKESLPRSIQAMQNTKKTADKHGLMLLAYEGGQHMVGVAGGENNQTMTALFHQANAHPRMGQIYDKYFDAWTAAGGDIFCYFSSVSNWSKWGSWGAMQYADEDPKQSPKMQAIVRWAQKCGQKIGADQGTAGPR